tara:strand:- start:2100 stop:2846 length:747 start_codon:yes stop_codon:yes gene_type:complete
MIKASIPIALCLLLLISCGKEGELTFMPLVVDKKECEECPKISIAIPKAVGQTKLAKTINTALEEEIISLLIFDDEITIKNLDDALISFKNGYLELKERYADETAVWEAKIEGTIRYEDATILTIELDSYLFTGGAHGDTSERFLNFDKTKGTELENWELFKSKADFLKFAETKFREQEAIPSDKSINHTGLMFEEDSFYLPENIGFTDKGIELLYNRYEVASYADGPIILTLPYVEVKPYLVAKLKS